MAFSGTNKTAIHFSTDNVKFREREGERERETGSRRAERKKCKQSLCGVSCVAKQRIKVFFLYKKHSNQDVFHQPKKPMAEVIFFFFAYKAVL